MLSRDEIDAELRTWNPFIWRTANRLARKYRTDPDDVANEIRLQWVRAGRTFDRSRGVKFATYAHRLSVLKAVAFCRREAFRGMRVTEGERGRFPRVVSTTRRRGRRGLVVDLAGRPAADPVADFWERMLTGLPPRQAEAVLLRFREELEPGEAAERMGISTTHVLQFLDTAIAHILARVPA